jgi:hypothetical protein
MIENGLYVVRFNTPMGAGAGVANLHDGKLRGGDSMMAYVGSYSVKDGKLTADVLAYTHTRVPGMESVFGAERVEIHLTGAATQGTAQLTGTSPQAPGVTLRADMERLHD